MAKEVTGKIKLPCPGGQATPAPPVGPALGSHGVNIAAFVKQFNEATRGDMGLIIPVGGGRQRPHVRLHPQVSARFGAPEARSEAREGRGCRRSRSGRQGVARASEEIAKMKMKDLNCRDLAAAVRIVEGTARSSGIKVEG